MPKKKIEKKLDKCFISQRVKTDKYIRDAIYRNYKQIESLDIVNIHKRILKTLGLKSKADSKFFSYDEFICLLNEVSVLTREPTELSPLDLI